MSTRYWSSTFTAEMGTGKLGHYLFFDRMTPLVCIVVPLLFLLWKIAIATAFGNHYTRRYGDGISLASLTSSYSEARFVRTQQGHDMAQPHYRNLLDQNPNDITAATRIAAGPDSPVRHDAAFVAPTLTSLRDNAHQLRALLTASRFVNDEIVQLLGLPAALADTCAGPSVFLTPCSAGSSAKLPISMNAPSALECLVALFLLGLAVPLVALQQAIGQESIQLLEKLGLAFPCQANTELIIPYVHIFPLSIPDEIKLSTTLWLVTDLHPRVLSTTTVGTMGHGTVMYIGPDSLALYQNFITSLSLLPISPLSCVDLCTGSGVQVLAALSTMDSIQTATVLDINPRALRFTHFNAVLNGLDDCLHRYILGDLVSGQGRLWQPDEVKPTLTSSLLLDLLGPFSPSRHYMDRQVVLANPPFLPVPSHDAEIQQRYGLFSDGGGPSGERVLQAIVELCAAMTNRSKSTTLIDVGIVSEFVNPPDGEHDVLVNTGLLHRLQTWWGSNSEYSVTGFLFTNEFPVNALTYAQRRADDNREAQIWLDHLEQQGISHISPGLLYIRARQRTKTSISPATATLDSTVENFQLQNFLVPKNENGSIWTPNNKGAVTFIHRSAVKLWEA